MIDIHNKKNIEESKEKLLNAYYSAYFHRVEKLKISLVENMIKEIDRAANKSSDKEKSMSAEDMFNRVKVLNAMYGGKTIESEG